MIFTRHCEGRSNLYVGTGLGRFFNKKKMVFHRGGCVYMMTNKYNSVLYTGVTSDIIGRPWEHKTHAYPNGFTSKYKCDKLVYYLFCSHIEEAIAEEKRIKGGSREAKIKLVTAFNPEWRDLYESLLRD